MRYRIYEENMERLEKKLTKIRNKCNKYGCDFHYEIVGEEFSKKDPTVEDSPVLRYVIVDVEGEAKVNNWKFVASIEFTEKGNIISRINNEIEVPERYYTSEPICEHCNSKRRRKNAYIILNTETNEFKQVGSSCLADFTHGLSAEGVAAYIQMYDELIKGEEPLQGGSCIRYYKTTEYLKYVFECVNKFGYSRSSDTYSTARRANLYYMFDNGLLTYMGEKACEELKEEMESVEFNPNSKEATQSTEEAFRWISIQKETNNYMHNLITACSLEYINSSNFGIVASLAPTFNKELERQAAERARLEELKKAQATSEHVGNIGDRITIKVDSFKVLTSWPTQWGETYMYSFIDEEGHTFIWKTAKYISKCDSLTATVKAHNEFRGIKQTEITRAKVTK